VDPDEGDVSEVGVALDDLAMRERPRQRVGVEQNPSAESGGAAWQLTPFSLRRTRVKGVAPRALSSRRPHLLSCFSPKAGAYEGYRAVVEQEQE